jgi:hypothetical protein
LEKRRFKLLSQPTSIFDIGVHAGAASSIFFVFQRYGKVKRRPGPRWNIVINLKPGGMIIGCKQSVCSEF